MIRRALLLPLLALFVAAVPAWGIVGGADTTPGAWPAVGALVVPGKKPLFERQFCAGTLVSSSVMVTAAHCVTNAKGEVRPPEDIEVAFTNGNLTDPAARIVPLEGISMAPGYVLAKSTGPDLAVLHLAEPVTDITPLPVASWQQRAAWDQGTMATVVGWGALSDGMGASFPDQLQAVQIPFVAPATCRLLVMDIQSAGALCAGEPSGRIDSCRGDSGGPLIGTDPLSGGPILVGVVSLGDGCAQRFRPGLYSHVPLFGDWLAQEGVPVGGVGGPINRSPAFRARAQAATAPARRGPVTFRYRFDTTLPTRGDIVVLYGSRRGRVIAWLQTSARATRALRTTRWRPPAALPRGVPLVWCVVGSQAGGAASADACAPLRINRP